MCFNFNRLLKYLLYCYKDKSIQSDTFALLNDEKDKELFLDNNITAQKHNSGFKQLSDGKILFVHLNARMLHKKSIDVLKIFGCTESDLLYKYK